MNAGEEQETKTGTREAGYTADEEVIVREVPTEPPS